MLQSLDDLRDSMQDIDTHLRANQGDRALMEMVNMHRKQIVAMEIMATAIDNGGIQNPHSRKLLSEYRCMTNLKTLGSDKSEFRSWNEKFVNVVAQALGTPWKKFLRGLNKA